MWKLDRLKRNSDGKSCRNKKHHEESELLSDGLQVKLKNIYILVGFTEI